MLVNMVIETVFILYCGSLGSKDVIVENNRKYFRLEYQCMS